jgi:type VI secretion system secreted protein Hcp
MFVHSTRSEKELAMKRIEHWIILLSIPALVHALPAMGAVQMFLDIAGIPGESTDKDHKDWIEVLSYSLGVANPASPGGGSSSGHASFSNVTFSKLVDSSSPKLFEATASGQHIADAVLDLVKSGGKGNEPFLKYTFTDVLVTSYAVSGGGDIPSDSFSLSYAKIKMEFFPQKADGSLGSPIVGEWDLHAAAVPEPSTWVVLVAGLAFVAFRGRRVIDRRAA